MRGWPRPVRDVHATLWFSPPCSEVGSLCVWKTLKGNMREKDKQKREWETIFKTARRGQAGGEKSSICSEQWINDKREESRFIAMLLFCCSVFFLLTQWTWRVQAAFYRSHATSQWSMDAGPLPTYTVEHALWGLAERIHLGEERAPPSQLPSHPLVCSRPLVSLWTSFSSLM